ncbi:protein lin-52 homolog [Coccinella septempunctata]|uniref:protein lin-52 homolog n=1 Tax=Coccinella septempunctata TaxID=41139 RepID=UPI001D07AA33|nr:protein lin-52 homolog [Coccinella septempunctata]
MASEKPGSVEQDQANALKELEASLYSMEILDRASPELWPEKFPGMSEYANGLTPLSTTKLPYSKELNQEDQNYMHQLASLPTAELITRVKQLHDIAYQLGVEEKNEVTRGKYLNLFNKKRSKS